MATAQPTTMHTCRNHNASNQMVILRCIAPEASSLEKVAFPLEQWLFRCLAQSRVEIWSHGLLSVQSGLCATAP
jgi:hypothetical protein